MFGIIQTLASLGFPVSKGTFTVSTVTFTGTAPTGLTFDYQWSRSGDWIDLDIGIVGTGQGSGVTRVDLTGIAGIPKPDLVNGQIATPTSDRPRCAGDACATNNSGGPALGGAGLFVIGGTSDQYRITITHGTLSAIAYRSHFRYKSTQG